MTSNFGSDPSYVDLHYTNTSCCAKDDLVADKTLIQILGKWNLVHILDGGGYTLFYNPYIQYAPSFITRANIVPFTSNYYKIQMLDNSYAYVDNDIITINSINYSIKNQPYKVGACLIFDII